ncbi:PIN domain-containing protein [Nocardia asiatica]|uniref:PIN domain-containing protein n=1 Tax=Nocardia asiatica TaxID=209252 RepID=UPI0005C1717A|nr:PIN domain-containing protein [Nocardia asiatica]
MPIIVVDTNAVCRCPGLSSAAWKSLIEHATDWELQLMTAEVVVMETINVVRRDIQALRKHLESLGRFGLPELGDTVKKTLDAHNAGFDEWLTARLGEAGVQVVPTPAIPHMEIARRASETIPPYTVKSKDGYRDTLIWFTLLDIAERHPDQEVWLGSANTGDFGAEKIDSDAVPAKLQPSLVRELHERGLADRVRYVTKLDILEAHLASECAPLTPQQLRERSARFAQGRAWELLVNGMLGYQVDPASVALPFLASAAEVVGCAEKPLTEWLLTDAAGRGGDAWTARFTLDTEVDIEAVDQAGATREHSKILRISGILRVTATDEMEALTVTSIEALPEDPDRGRWKRRRSRRAGNTRKTTFHIDLSDLFDSSAVTQIMRDSIGDAIDYSAITEVTRNAIDPSQLIGHLPHPLLPQHEQDNSTDDSGAGDDNDAGHQT